MAGGEPTSPPCFKMANEKPIGQAIVVCDQIITEAQTNKKSLIGTFNTIGAEAFPMRYLRLCVYAALTNGRGTIPAELRCVCTEDSKTVFACQGSVQFRDPNQVVEIHFVLNGVPFAKPGVYAFELFCEGEPVLEKRFNVILS